MRCFKYLLITITLLSGCSGSQNKVQQNKNTNQYAHGFQIEKNNEFTKLSVFNPWQKARNVSFDYYLVEKNQTIPHTLSHEKIIRTPVERIICLSTTHIAFLDVLNETHTVFGISGSDYVSNLKVRTRIEQGEVPDVGYGQNLNYELMVNQKPDLVLAFGVGSEVTSQTQKLEELGIPVIMVAEYLEENPLGKAEWIKFVATLFQKEEEAESYFIHVENEYLRLKLLAANQNQKPKVMVGSPYNDSWWVPGGNSYLANLIADAGGEYLGKSNNSHESYVISFENALVWGSEANVWINMSNMASKKEIAANDQRFQNFRVFREGKIYNNIKRLGSHGGNDFWESGTVHPHLVLRDLIAVFHPGLIEEELTYYLELK